MHLVKRVVFFSFLHIVLYILCFGFGLQLCLEDGAGAALRFTECSQCGNEITETKNVEYYNLYSLTCFIINPAASKPWSCCRPIAEPQVFDYLRQGHGPYR